MNEKRILKNKQGGVLPLVAIILGLFALGFIALVIDLGFLYVERKAMITSADAAALAGAQVLREYKVSKLSDTEAIVKAKEIAKEYAIANGAEESQVDIFVGSKLITLPNGDKETRQIVEVTVGKNKKLIFALFLGDEDTDVKAHAIATWGYVHKTYIGNFIPLFTFDKNYELDKDIYLHENIEDTNSYGFVDIGRGMDGIKEAIAGNIVGGSYIYDNYLKGEPGNGASLYGAVVERMIKAQKEPTPAERSKFMIGLVPIIDWVEFNKITENKNSSSNWKLPINYFAYYEILDVIKQSTYVGSAEALNPSNQYKRKGEPAFNYQGKLPSNLLKKNGDDVENVTIVGQFTGDTVDAKTIAEAGDQINPNPGGDAPATYSKLIK